MNVNEMTLDEVRDALAWADGWNKWNVATTVDGVTKTHRETWQAPNQEGKTTINFGPHPHPATLDGAAAALPEGWTLHALEQVGSISGWSCAAIAHYPLPAGMCCGHAPDELTARYRLALACRLAEKGDKQ